MTSPIPSESLNAINQMVSQVTQGEVKGLKQLSQAERKAVKSALEHLVKDDHQPIMLDGKIAQKISTPENYHKNPIRSLVKGIARKLFTSYIDTNSLAKFISDNSSLIRQHMNPPQNPTVTPQAAVSKQEAVVSEKGEPKTLSQNEKIVHFKQDWEQNKEASLSGQKGAFTKSSELLGKLFSDKSIGDEAVLQFLQDIHINPTGGFFETKGQPTDLAKLLIQERPQVSSAFTKKTETPEPVGQGTQTAATVTTKQSDPVASTPTPPKVPPRFWVEKASSVDPSIPSNTATANKTPTGSYKSERRVVHQDIKAQIIGQSKPVPADQKPVALIMMGPPGAGKSMAISQLTKGSDQFVEVGMDNVMERIPEYKKAINLGTDKDGKIITAKDACLITRDEANDITSSLRNEVIASRRNLIYDGTGQNFSLYQKMIAKLKEDGYDVQLYYVDIDVDQAKQRAKDRAERVGRSIPDHVIESIHGNAKANFQKIAKLADTAVLFDNRNPPPQQACKYEHGSLTEGQQYLDQKGF
ncbi:zeta toxin family protein [Estrella lausannensis]|uniref:Zeta toxin domain-containing protein n=1 Tax=Estrella lausannensis TaxID=483423 RepID=A0A0H5DP39_9BACT|nr:zeta toxin family protein [Estrella lausannensis]CRX37668.1 Hypothetical protein ELAC_0307 [Estrella lausannensis]